MSFVSCGTGLLTARDGNNHHTRPTTVLILKRIRHIQVALHEVIDTTGSTLSKFRNDDPALDQASSYPLCNAHNHFSTFATSSGTSLPDATAKITEDAAHTPTISLVLPQASEFTRLASNVSRSPRQHVQLSL